MGGTFDPIHVGHLAAASEAMGVLNLDEVVFVPAIPSHKMDQKVTDKEHRFNMVQLAVSDNPRFTVSRADIDRGKPTYTIDTLTDLKTARGDNTDLFFITGADVVKNIPNWNQSQALYDLADFVAVSRSGHQLDCNRLPEGKVTQVQLPAVAMSSTEVRSRLSNNRPVWYWLPSPVITYMCIHDLYETSWRYGNAR